MIYTIYTHTVLNIYYILHIRRYIVYIGLRKILLSMKLVKSLLSLEDRTPHAQTACRAHKADKTSDHLAFHLALTHWFEAVLRFLLPNSGHLHGLVCAPERSTLSIGNWAWNAGRVMDDMLGMWSQIWDLKGWILCLPSMGLTYPTLGKGKSSSKCHFWGIC